MRLHSGVSIGANERDVEDNDNNDHENDNNDNTSSRAVRTGTLSTSRNWRLAG
jgi:hypothetical protein